MRTTLMGALTPPIEGTPGMRLPGAQDHLAADPLAQQRVGAAHVAGRLGRDGGRLDAEAALDHGVGGLEHDRVVGGAAVLQREVEAAQLELDPDDLGRDHAQRLLEELLTGLVALEDGDGCAHRATA